MSQSAHQILRKYAATSFTPLYQWHTEDLLDLQERIEEEIQYRAELAAEPEPLPFDDGSEGA